MQSRFFLLSNVAAITAALTLFSCAQRSKADPWQVFYELVPQPPGAKEVVSEGSFSRTGAIVPLEISVVPQVQEHVGEVVKKFGQPDSVVRYAPPFPVSFRRPLLGLKSSYVDTSGDSSWSYQLKGKRYCWGCVSVFVEDDIVSLVIVEAAPDAALHIYAPVGHRIATPEAR